LRCRTGPCAVPGHTKYRALPYLTLACRPLGDLAITDPGLFARAVSSFLSSASHHPRESSHSYLARRSVKRPVVLPRSRTAPHRTASHRIVDAFAGAVLSRCLAASLPSLASFAPAGPVAARRPTIGPRRITDPGNHTTFAPRSQNAGALPPRPPRADAPRAATRARPPNPAACATAQTAHTTAHRTSAPLRRTRNTAAPSAVRRRAARQLQLPLSSRHSRPSAASDTPPTRPPAAASAPATRAPRPAGLLPSPVPLTGNDADNAIHARHCVRDRLDESLMRHDLHCESQRPPSSGITCPPPQAPRMRPQTACIQASRQLSAARAGSPVTPLWPAAVALARAATYRGSLLSYCLRRCRHQFPVASLLLRSAHHVRSPPRNLGSVLRFECHLSLSRWQTALLIPSLGGCRLQLLARLPWGSGDSARVPRVAGHVEERRPPGIHLVVFF